MILTNKLQGYKISKDYKRLVELMGYGYSVLCAFEYRSHIVQGFNAVANIRANGRYTMTESCTDDGISILVISEKTEEAFIAACKKSHIEFIDIQLP